MLDRDSMGLFIEREKKQGLHLRKALLGRHQTVFQRPRREIPQLRAKRASLLNAHNAYARVRWMRGLGGYVCEHLGAEAPDWLPDQPVYFLTVIDQEQAHSLRDEPWSPETQGRHNEKPIPDPDLPGFYTVRVPRGPNIQAIRRSYSRLLPGLNYVGMIDVAYYASVHRVLGHNNLLLPHVHGLVWGVSEGELDAVCQDIRKQIKPLLPYATAARYARVRDGDLLQMVWYVCKTPYKQYQLGQREKSNSLQQWDRRINGVNSVRLYADLHDVTLDQLTLAGGEGRPLLKALRQDVQRWQRNAREKGYI